MQPEIKPAPALKVQSMSVVTIELTDGLRAYFVPDGPDWNGLRAYRCIAPGAYVNDRILTVPPSGPDGVASSGFRSMFENIFGVVEEQRQIVMASPSLASVFKHLLEAQAAQQANAQEGGHAA